MDTLYDDVEINVNVAPPVMNYQDKEVFVVDEVGVTVRPDNGYDALASVDINPVLESKVVNVTSNGTTSVVPSDGFCGIGDITVNVNVPSVDSVKTQIGNIVFDYTPPKSYTCKVNNMIDLGSYANLTTFNVYSAPEAVQIFIAVKCLNGVFDKDRVCRLSYFIVRNASSSDAAFSVQTIFGFKPDMVYRLTLWMRSEYPSLSAYAACLKFLGFSINYSNIRTSDGFVILNNVVSIVRTCTFADAISYQSGPLNFLCLQCS